MVIAHNKNSVINKLVQLYGYQDRTSFKDIKELALALLGDPLTRQHGFELILARPVPVTEIANNSSLHEIWNIQDSKTTLQELEVVRSVESIVD